LGRTKLTKLTKQSKPISRLMGLEERFRSVIASR
jgi:hypothetical protein